MHTYHVLSEQDHDVLLAVSMEIIVTTHISMIEEKYMCIPLAKTIQWKELHIWPDSDAIMAYEELQRKRAASSVSQSSTSTTALKYPPALKTQSIDLRQVE